MLKKLLLLLPLAALLNGSAQAQFRYTFKDTTTAYTPLPASATLVNGTTIWAGNNYQLPMPFAWSIDSTTQKSVLNLDLGSFGAFSDPSSSVLTGFTLAGADFVDRGRIDSVTFVSRSPIRYITTGTAPNRIFKVEIANAGFSVELDQFETLDDSVSQQIWIYEVSSTVELHYGPSKVSNFNDYFDLGFGSASLIIGLVKDLDFSGPSGTIYYLGGPPASVSVKSITLPDFPTDGLDSWPASGKVFRFTPKKKIVSGIADLAALGNVKVYPNPTSGSLIVEDASAGTKATLYSMLGQPVLQTVLAGSQTLDIAAFPTGVYKLVLTDKEGVSGATTIVKE